MLLDSDFSDTDGIFCIDTRTFKTCGINDVITPIAPVLAYTAKQVNNNSLT